MNEFTITLTLMDMIQYGSTILSAGASIGYLTGRYLCKTDIRTSLIQDTCQVPMFNKFGNKPYDIKKYYVNEKCRDVICDFLEDKKTCSYNRRNNKNNKKCNYL